MSIVNRVSVHLSAVLGAALAAVLIVRAQPAPAGVAPVMSINHLHIHVSDSRKSYEFYSKLLGGHIIDTSRGGWTFMIGDTGRWINFSGVPPQMPNIKPGTLNHIGIGINLPDKPEPLRQALKEAFPSSNVRSPGKPGDLTYDRSIYIDDPDGLSIQLVSKTDDGHLPRPDETPAVPRTATAGVVRVRSINHLQFPVGDAAKTQAFYAKLLGATLRDKSANGRSITLTLPGTSSWLSFATTADKDRAGKLDHIGIGIDWPNDPETLRTALKNAFPGAKVTSPGSPTSPTYNRSIYIDDPDGFHLQLISSTDDGNLPGGVLSKK
jgi:catechol 2,3-dioxygenase-like lactoylglutathione lyase family enzyme